jgi:hypothetical protein
MSTLWVKTLQISDVIDIQRVLKDYLDSAEHKFTVRGQSQLPTNPAISDSETQRPLPLEGTVAT